MTAIFEKRLEALEAMMQPTVDVVDAPRLSLIEFIRQAWGIIEPGVDFQENWHHAALAEFLEGLATGWTRRLICNVAPRSGKSTLASVLYPVWLWSQRPQMKLLCASYAEELAVKFSVARRRLILSEWFCARWGSLFTLNYDQSQKHFYRNSAGGEMRSIGLDGSATGFGGDLMIFDDLHGAQESEAEIKTTVEKFGKTFPSRLDDKKQGKILIIGQRISHQDLIGHLLEQELWTHVFLPSVAALSTTLSFPSGKTVEIDNVVRLPSGREIVREPGSYLWESREGKAELEALHRSMGDTAYGCQYLQNPNPEGGSVFNESHFKYYDEEDRWLILHKPSGDKLIEKQALITWQTIDVAASVKQSADYSAILTWSTFEGDLILRHCWRGRKSPEALKCQMELLKETWEAQILHVESANVGLAVIDAVKDRPGWYVQELKALKDKKTRSMQFAIQIEQGRVYFPRNAAYMIDLKAELCQFPGGPHDDMVDCCSYAGTIARNDYMPTSPPIHDFGDRYAYRNPNSPADVWHPGMRL